ncbi:hypothetical protein PsorP6_012268 [Peronosclerospora sorghi]|uniref:Uncharacterized protein n=1 Tax=Peronosclerospora sorghi TaxID=230839 RepID=A0ACC0WL34_9STRA|nr:hypothetical protein PsorP6_012268 [Peronosclerospora sorghi]
MVASVCQVTRHISRWPWDDAECAAGVVSERSPRKSLANDTSKSAAILVEFEALLAKSVAGKSKERSASSLCPSSYSSDCSSSSENGSSSSSNSSDSDNDSASRSEDAAPPPPVNNSNNGGDGNDREEKKGDEEVFSSSSESSADESDLEDEEGVLIDSDDDNDKTLDAIDPTDDDLSGESDDSSDLEISYPRLPIAPVEKLIRFRQYISRNELQLTERQKQKVIADAKQRHQGRQQAQRSKKKKQYSQDHRRHSKSDVVSSEMTHLKRNQSNKSTDVTPVLRGQEEDEWMVDCSCGLKKKNYDDGTSMIQCDSCSHWVHAKCAGKQPEEVAQEKFLCFRCGWIFNCMCSVRRRPNHDDGQRMVECVSCETWQHTMCVGISMTEQPADNYRCPRCVKKGRRKHASRGNNNRDRQRKRSLIAGNQENNTDASPVDAADVRSSVNRSFATPYRSNRTRRAQQKEFPKLEMDAVAHPVSPVPAMNLSSTSLPSLSHSGTSKKDHRRKHTVRNKEIEQICSTASNTSAHRKRSRPQNSPSSSNNVHSVSDKMELLSPQTAETPSPRGKGFMLRGYSRPTARISTSSSQAVDVRPPLLLTSPSGASDGNSHSSQNNDHSGRKRKVSSVRDRLAKKLRMRKSSLR